MNTILSEETYTDNIVAAHLDTLVVSDIQHRIQIRSIKASGVERLKEKIQKFGFLPQHPLLVIRNEDGTCELLDGNHRLEAAIALGYTTLPVLVLDEPFTDNEKKKRARQANEASETVVPTTFVDDAEFVWKEAEQGKTQQEIGDIIGWGRGKVSQYALLQKIDQRAWEVIATVVEKNVATNSEEGVAGIATDVAFSEFLLRDIVSLTSEQQVELVTALAHPDKDKRITKGKFKTLAESYHARNEMHAYALEQLGNLGEPYTSQLTNEIAKGAYDTDWKVEGHPKLTKLILSLREEWEKKNSIHLIHGDFYEQVKNVGTDRIDLILTDPPYNVANEREFILEGRSNISQDFGIWDKYEHQAFIDLFDIWAHEWARILKEHGSGYVFTSDGYISHLREALERAGLHVKATIVWHKSNPGTQVVKTNFKSSVEYILFFTKGEGGHTFNWQGENEMHNFLEAPICSGNERIVDAKKDTLHPTQKPERVIRHFMEISSNRGDTVFDGFMGVGTTGKVSKDTGRKFIGIEQDSTFFEAAVRRVE